jgi:peptide/nickel transport system permease protein
LLTLLVVSILIFSAVELLPGDLAQAVLGQGATEETVARCANSSASTGRSSCATSTGWAARFGDFGVSLMTGEPVAAFIGERFMNTLFLAAYAAVIAVPIAIILGVIVALLRNTVFDRVANVLTLTSISSPEFFLGYILILFLAVKWSMFPAIASLSHDMNFGELLLPHLPARADAGAGRHRAHDADDPGGDHQPARLALYRDGAAQGRAALEGDRETTRCPTPGRRSSTSSR